MYEGRKQRFTRYKNMEFFMAKEKDHLKKLEDK